MTMGDAQLDFTGALELGLDRYLVDVDATLPPTDCNAAVHAIPADLLGELAGFSLDGRIGGHARAHVDSTDLEHLSLDLDVNDGCVFQTVPALADLGRVRAPFLHRVQEPDGSWFEMTTGPGTLAWSSIYATSPFLVHAILAHEDGAFFHHHGFSVGSIRDALERNLRAGSYVYGASTITMQLAKNLFLHREKYLARKVQEVLLTWWLESALEKADILELYVNVIEYGPSIYGLRAAAEHYFGRDPSELSPAESAFLACILPNPKLYHGQYERDEISPSMKNRMRNLLTHMHARGRINQAALEFGLAEVDTLRFHHEGDPPVQPRVIAGDTTPLPLLGGTARWADWPDDDAGGWGGGVDDEGWDDDNRGRSPPDPL